MKVTATPSALDLIEELKKSHGKELLFHQSGGCCDGSAPMCYPAKEYQVGQDDVMIGKIGGIPFYISETQHTAWKNTDLVIDCVKGMGGMFSLDNGTGRRFLTRSEICVPEKNLITKFPILLIINLEPFIKHFPPSIYLEPITKG